MADRTSTNVAGVFALAPIRPSNESVAGLSIAYSLRALSTARPSYGYTPIGQTTVWIGCGGYGKWGYRSNGFTRRPIAHVSINFASRRACVCGFTALITHIVVARW